MIINPIAVKIEVFENILNVIGNIAIVVPIVNIYNIYLLFNFYYANGQFLVLLTLISNF